MTTSISNDPVEDTAKQDILSNLREQIIDMFDHDAEGDIVNGIVQGVTAEDIGNYLHQIVSNQSTQLKELSLTEVPISDPCDIWYVLERISASQVDLSRQPKIYFLEDADFAIVLIPINLNMDNTNVFIQPLDYAPKEIRDIWSRAKGKNKMTMADIKFVKFGKNKDQS